MSMTTRRVAHVLAGCWMLAFITTAAASGLVRHAIPVLLAVSVFGAVLGALTFEASLRLGACKAAALPHESTPAAEPRGDRGDAAETSPAGETTIDPGESAAHQPESQPAEPDSASPDAADPSLAPASRPSTCALTHPKLGSGSDENEDGAAVDPEQGLAVVSDGASSSYDSGRWAQHLCASYVAQKPQLNSIDFRTWLDSAVASFSASTDSEQVDAGWWGDAVADAASHATLIAVSLDLDGPGRRPWSAVAVGDSVVVHVSARPAGWQMVDAFPIEHSGGFGGRPWLLSSQITGPRPPIRFLAGTAEPDDVLLLMSDELCHWALSRAESDQPVWDALLAADDLAGIVDDARAAGEMVNDDCTLVRLVVPGGSS